MHCQVFLLAMPAYMEFTTMHALPAIVLLEESLQLTVEISLKKFPYITIL